MVADRHRGRDRRGGRPASPRCARPSARDRDVVVDFHGRIVHGRCRAGCCRSSNRSARCSSKSPSCPNTAATCAAWSTRSAVPLATGERIYSRWDFRRVLRHWHRRRPAGCLARRRHQRGAAGSPRWPRPTTSPLAPHCPLGPIALAASLQVGVRDAEPADPGAEPAASTTTRATTCSTTCVDPTPLRFDDGHASFAERRRARRRRSTRPRSNAPPRWATAGATRCGATPTERSGNGDARQTRARRRSRPIRRTAAGGPRCASRGREWLWHHADPARTSVRPGAPFVDAGGLEECIPTVRGTPDHGLAWSRPWQRIGDEDVVDCAEFTLHRRVSTSPERRPRALSRRGRTGLSIPLGGACAAGPVDRCDDLAAGWVPDPRLPRGRAAAGTALAGVRVVPRRQVAGPLRARDLAPRPGRRDGRRRDRRRRARGRGR